MDVWLEGKAATQKNGRWDHAVLASPSSAFEKQADGNILSAK